MRGFSRIDQISIKTCFEMLSINEEQLKTDIERVGNINALLEDCFYSFDKSSVNSEVKSRVKDFVYKDRQQYLNCSSIEDFERYLAETEFGLWRKEAHDQMQILKEIKEEELLFSKKTSRSLKMYIKRFPRGRFINEAQELYRKKKKQNRIRMILYCTIFLVALFFVCYLNYKPSSYISLKSESSSFKLTDSLFIRTDSITIKNRGEKLFFSIQTDASSNNIDVSVVPESGDWLKAEIRDKRLYIEADTNHVGEKDATIRLFAYASFFGKRIWCKDYEVHVNQESGFASFLDVSEKSCRFDKFGKREYSNNKEEKGYPVKTSIQNNGSKVASNTKSQDYYLIEISTDGLNLKVETDVDWITMEKSKKDNGEIIKYSLIVKASANDGDQHDANIMVTSDTYSETIKVHQASGLATFFNVSTNDLIMEEKGTDEIHYYPVQVSTDGTTWHVSSSPSWLTAKANIKSGELEVRLPRNTGRINTGTIIIASNNNDLSQEISVKQLGDPTNLDASPKLLKFDTSGDSKYVYFSNNSIKPISVSEDQYWIQTDIVDDNRIQVSCYRIYDSESPRSGTVTVTCGNEKTYISVKQKGWAECSKCNNSGKMPCDNPKARAWDHSVWGVERISYDMWGQSWPIYNWVSCNRCKGTRKIKCTQCGGKGLVLSY